MRPEGIALFAGDLSPEEQGVVYATHFPPALDLFLQNPAGGIAWRSKPSWSIVAARKVVALCSPTWNGQPRSAWALRRSN